MDQKLDASLAHEAPNARTPLAETATAKPGGAEGSDVVKTSQCEKLVRFPTGSPGRGSPRTVPLNRYCAGSRDVDGSMRLATDTHTGRHWNRTTASTGVAAAT